MEVEGVVEAARCSGEWGNVQGWGKGISGH